MDGVGSFWRFAASTQQPIHDKTFENYYQEIVRAPDRLTQLSLFLIVMGATILKEQPAPILIDVTTLLKIDHTIFLYSY